MSSGDECFVKTEPCKQGNRRKHSHPARLGGHSSVTRVIIDAKQSKLEQFVGTEAQRFARDPQSASAGVTEVPRRHPQSTEYADWLDRCLDRDGPRRLSRRLKAARPRLPCLSPHRLDRCEPESERRAGLMDHPFTPVRGPLEHDRLRTPSRACRHAPTPTRGSLDRAAFDR